MTDALRHYQQATQIAHAVGDDFMEAASLNNMALVCQQTNRPALALQYMQQAFEVDNAGRQDPISLTNLGIVLQTVGRLRDATRTFQEVIRIAHTAGSDYAEAVARSSLAHTYLEMDRPEAAQEHLDTAMGQYRKIGSSYGIAIALMLSARASTAVSKHEQALAEIDSAISQTALLNDPRIEGEARCIRGHVLDILNRPADAEAEYHRSLELAEAVDSVDVRVSARLGLAARLNNSGRADLALVMADKAVNDADIHGFQVLVCRALAIRASIYHKRLRGDLACQDAERAAAIQRATGVSLSGYLPDE